MVKQVNREYKVKNERILKLYQDLMKLLMGFDKWRIEYISRSENKEADSLSKLALKKRG